MPLFLPRPPRHSAPLVPAGLPAPWLPSAAPVLSGARPRGSGGPATDLLPRPLRSHVGERGRLCAFRAGSTCP